MRIICKSLFDGRHSLVRSFLHPGAKASTEYHIWDTCFFKQHRRKEPTQGRSAACRTMDWTSGASDHHRIEQNFFAVAQSKRKNYVSWGFFGPLPRPRSRSRCRAARAALTSMMTIDERGVGSKKLKNSCSHDVWECNLMQDSRRHSRLIYGKNWVKHNKLHPILH